MPLLLLAMLEIIMYFSVVGLSAGEASIVLRQTDQSLSHIWLLIVSIFAVMIAMVYAAFRYLLRKRVFVWQ